MYVVDEEECTGCGVCMEDCPVGAIEVKGRVAWIDQDICTSCGSCSDVCPQKAIYEYEDVPALYEGARAPAVSTARWAPPAVGRRSTALARREKVAAAVVLVPAFSRLLLRLAGRISLRGGGNRLSAAGSSSPRPSQPAGATGRGRHRWRGGC